MHDSYIIKNDGTFTIWYSKGDEHPYWVSDLDGTEIISFETYEEAVNWISIENKKRIIQ
jgi:hypothetical protein